MLRSPLFICNLAAFICAYRSPFPLLRWYITTSLLFSLSYNPWSPDWLASVWIWLHPALFLLRLGCVMEFCWLRSHSRRMLIGLMLICIPYAAICWVYQGGHAVASVLQIGRQVQIYTAVLMLVTLTLLWTQKLWVWDFLGLHGLILWVLTTKQAVFSILGMRGAFATGTAWQLPDALGLAISATCFWAWALLHVIRLHAVQRRAAVHRTN